MLLEQEGEEHEQAAVVHDPPDVDVALNKVVIEVDGWWDYDICNYSLEIDRSQYSLRYLCDILDDSTFFY